MNLGYDLCEVRSGLSAEELWNVEKYFREQGVSEFVCDSPPLVPPRPQRAPPQVGAAGQRRQGQ